MRELITYVEVRDDAGQLLKTTAGKKVTDFRFRDNFNGVDDAFLERHCRRMFDAFFAISQLPDIYVSVMELDTISQTYPAICSYDGKDDIFRIHK